MESHTPAAPTQKTPASMIHGFLNIDKPAGMTSHDVVARVRRSMGTKRVGHAGTLDPAATGVLVVALGTATRLIEYVQEETTKRYHAEIRLGITTTTDDAEGEVTASSVAPTLDLTDLHGLLDSFTGVILQVPPIYSALHHQGQRMHTLARAGVDVQLEPRPVQIERIDLLNWDSPLLTLDIWCGKGTYIRALARDIGVRLGCGAHLASLRRTAVGMFTIADAVTLDQLPQPLLPPEVAVAEWPMVTLNDAMLRMVRNGMPLDLPSLVGDRIRAHSADGVLQALLFRQEQRWKPEKVFSWT